MEVLQQWVDQSSFPILSAFLLGLMMAISPCPLGTNITAVGYISKDLTHPKRVFFNGMMYTLGRVFSYSVLGFLLKLGGDQFQVATLFQGWGEKILGPLLIIIGLFMLGVISINFSWLGNWTDKVGKKDKISGWSAFVLGVIFALAFCPYSGVLFFGVLVPMTISSGAMGWALPPVFALATGIPVLIFAWIIVFAVDNLTKVYNGVKVFEKWFRYIVAFLFIGVGVYYIVTLFLV
ncbi:sulfite exporter TauE/SafE family protein [Prolixibacteraceae bacterium JC049]|nr:sulfite exporter TauE/SafE family protein [Prolixibacteraceae bacterium JC049]